MYVGPSRRWNRRGNGPCPYPVPVGYGVMRSMLCVDLVSQIRCALPLSIVNLALCVDLQRVRKSVEIGTALLFLGY